MYDILVTPKDVKDIDTAQFCSLFEISKKEFLQKIEYASTGYNVSYKASTFIESMSKEEYSRVVPYLKILMALTQNEEQIVDTLMVLQPMFWDTFEK